MEKVTYRLRHVGSGRFLHVRRCLEGIGMYVYRLEDRSPSLDDWEALPPFEVTELTAALRIFFHVNTHGVFPEFPQNPFNEGDLEVVKVTYKEEAVC